MTEAFPSVRHPSEAEEYFSDENCHILEVWNSSGDPAASIARARVEPGVSTRLHRVVGTAERYLILRGSGLVEIGGLRPDVVAAGDMVYIPPGYPQRITNLGTEDLVFLAICTPRFVPEAYENVDWESERGDVPAMANIHIKRAHRLGLDNARVEVEKIARSLKSDLQADYKWSGNKLLFERSGASGTIDVGGDYIDLDIKLGLLLSPMKGKIEDSIIQKLDAALS